MRFSNIRLIKWVLLILTVCLTGCMVGPDFRSPPLPATKTYLEEPLPRHTTKTPTAGLGGKSQKFVINKDIAADWWRLFHSREINQLVDLGLKNSPTLTSAMAALRQAQETVNQQTGNLLLPAASINFSGERQKFSPSVFGVSTGATTFIIPSIFNLFNAGVSVSYTLDLFGGARRQIEALIAQADYQQFQLMAAYLSLTSNIVTTAITMASVQAQIDATLDLIRYEDAQLIILKKQFQLGGISLANVLTQTTLVSQTKATLPPLQQQLAVAKHQMAALIGSPTNVRIPNIDLDKLVLPKEIPVSLPGNLVRQRPDIRAAEALLHEASAQVGVATANLFPQVPLTGSYGWESLVLTSMLERSKIIWAMVANATQPLFKGGSLMAARRAAIANFDVALANYRQAVLTAFQNVADSLKAIQHDSNTLYSFKNAENAAHQSLILTTQQFHLGGTTYLALLIAQQQYELARLNRIRSQAARYTDTAALFQALGGGWWHYPCAPTLALDGWPCNVNAKCRRSKYA